MQTCVIQACVMQTCVIQACVIQAWSRGMQQLMHTTNYSPINSHFSMH
jgi:hypothetical protein